MSNEYQSAIDSITALIAAKEEEILPLRITLNQLCKLAGVPEAYPGASSGATGSTKAGSSVITWRSDQFFNRPLATCVTEYFEAREKASLGRPATIDEIYDALRQGGYKFEGTTGNDANTKRGIKISLTKNTAQFVKLPDDSFSLKKWYGTKPARKSGAKPEPQTDAEAIEQGLDEAIEKNPTAPASQSTEDDPMFR